MVARNQAGRAPMQATSLALTWTAYQPMRSVAKVTGSALATRARSAESRMTAASSPIAGPTSTRGSRRTDLSRRRASRRAGSLPVFIRARIAVLPPLYTPPADGLHPVPILTLEGRLPPALAAGAGVAV